MNRWDKRHAPLRKVVAVLAERCFYGQKKVLLDCGHTQIAFINEDLPGTKARCLICYHSLEDNPHATVKRRKEPVAG